MKWTLYLGKIAKIKLYMHWTFLILIGWILLLHFQQGNSLFEGLIGVAYILSIFFCVVLHELGHALTARRFDIITRNIILLPIGGLANMERIPEKPSQELAVALMGPLVNVLIALLLYLSLRLTENLISLEQFISQQQDGLVVNSGANFLYNLMLANVVLVLFNLIPAFPMDGGRALRAILGYSFSRTKATNIAAGIGQILAILFVFAGFYTNFWLVFIGIFIFLGAGGEAQFEASKSVLAGYKVKDVSISNFTLLAPEETLGAAAKNLLNGLEQEFLVGDKNSILGILTRKNIIQGLSEFGKEAPVSNFVRKDFLQLQPEMELKEVFLKMAANGCSIAPVYDELRLIGILDRENLNELVMVNRALTN